MGLRAATFSKKLPTNKGTMQSVTDGAECLLGATAQLIDKPILLQIPAAAPSMAAGSNNLPSVLESSPQRLFCATQRSPMAQELMSSRTWLQAVDQALQVAVPDSWEDDDHEVSINLHKHRANLVAEADQLSHLLWQRMPSLLERRLPHMHKDKREHPIWGWVGRNIPPVALIMVRGGHVLNLQDMKCAQAGDCLLKADCKYFQPVDITLADLQGCYLYYHKPKGKWRRSGKVCGQGSTFGQRGKNHLAGSKLSSADPKSTHFYRMFPHPESTDAGRCDARPGGGLFTDLEMHAAVAFDCHDAATTSRLTKDISEGGVLFWTDSDIAIARQTNVGGVGASLQRKQLELAAYLFEFTYDLLIGDDSVSTNPGFEAVIRYYGKDE